MKHVFGKIVVLFVASTLLSIATISIANAQIRTNPTLKTPTPGGSGPIISNGGAGLADLKISEGVFICVSGQNCPPPNSHLPGTGFCGYWNNGAQTINLVVWNHGQSASVPSQLRVEFLHSGAGLQSVANVPAIAPGEGHSLFLNVPSGAWSPGSHSSYHFRLRADSGNAVTESNERNNMATSHCIGPAS